jgi:hypothetical protein
MNGVFQFSFQKIGRSSKGKQQDGGEGGGEEEWAMRHCKKSKAQAIIISDIKFTWTC